MVGGFKRDTSTSLWIRDHLIRVGKDYPQQMSTLFRMQMRDKGYHPGSYQTFRIFIRALVRLGLIELVEEEIIDPQDFAVSHTKEEVEKLRSEGARLKQGNPEFLHSTRNYYSIVAGKEEDPAWDNIWKAIKEM